MIATAAGQPASISRSRRWVAGCAVAAAAGAFVALRPLAAVAIVSAVVLAALAWRSWLWPLVAFGALAISEEVASASSFGGRASPLVTVGSGLYRLAVGAVPVVAVAACALVGLVWLTRRDRDGEGLWFSALTRCVALLIAWCGAVGAAEALGSGSAGPSVVTAAVGSAAPWMTLGAAIIVGRAAVRAGYVSVIGAMVTLAVVLKATVAVVVIALGRAVAVDTQGGVVFVDAATPVAAFAALCGAGLSRQWKSRLVQLTVAGASVIIIVTSYRRSIWLMAVVAVLIAIVVRGRAFVLARALVVGALAVLVVVLVVPTPIRARLTERAVGAVEVVIGGRGEPSAQAHLTDISEGVALVERHPLLGLGPRAPQQPRLVNTNADHLYVHNELLQDWLRYGVVGAGLVCATFALITGRALRSLRHSEDSVVLGAAGLCVAIVVPLMTAPFVSTTMRWPLIVGLAAGILDAAEERPSVRGTTQVLAPVDERREVTASGGALR